MGFVKCTPTRTRRLCLPGSFAEAASSFTKVSWQVLATPAQCRCRGKVAMTRAIACRSRFRHSQPYAPIELRNQGMQKDSALQSSKSVLYKVWKFRLQEHKYLFRGLGTLGTQNP